KTASKSSSGEEEAGLVAQRALAGTSSGHIYGERPEDARAEKTASRGDARPGVYLPAQVKNKKKKILGRAALAAGLLVATVLLVWLGLSLRPPSAPEAPQPVEVLVEVTSPLPLTDAPPDLSVGTLARDREWQENLLVDVYEVTSGGTLSLALERLSVPHNMRQSLYQVLERKELLRHIRPGETFKAWWSSPARFDADLERLEYWPIGAVRPIIFLPGGADGFYVVELGSPTKQIHQATQGAVANTFWDAGLEAGLEPRFMGYLIELLASQIDFVSDIRAGDSFQILFLGEYQDGALVGRPKMDMIRFINQGRRFEFYRHVGPNGEEGFFDAQFRNIKQTFFRSPLQYTRISSSFSRARAHPILKIVRPHLGVDYAAPSGTPVSAVADGVIVSAGFRGDFGRLVVIDHQNDFQTMYGHLSLIAKGVTKGARVKQGDLIGNVGASGLATGPHLDFRIRQRGEFVNPEEVLAQQQGEPMPQDERFGFAEQVTAKQRLLVQLLEGS
ncbi:MAG: M23 family metallopeptidase, partial [Deltaproteobacteria bacterium]|nr:M23 family metallopeptidase [Deltaproteobacteria bacterium]